MTIKHLILLCSIILTSSYSIGQTPIDSLAGNLNQTPFTGIISGKTYSTKIIQVPQGLRCSESKHNYLWYKNKLIVQIDGSGYLYEYNSGQPLRRIDSTCFEGYNFGAFPFVHHDTLFSLGGYGFWHFNGMLRYYNEKVGEWEVVKTNKSVPVMLHLYSKPFYDIPNHQIYFIYVKPKQLNEDETYITDKTIYVQCFDLVSKKWWDEAKMFNEKISKSEVVGYLSPGPFHTKFGLVQVGETEVFLYDFKHNRLNTFLKDKTAQIHERFTPQKERLFYAKDSVLFFFDPQNGVIDSITFGKRDFVDTGTPIYRNSSNSEKLSTNPYPLAILLFVILAALLFSFLSFKNKKLKQRNEFLLNSHFINGKKGNSEITVANSESFRENLTEVEKGLLDILVTNTTIETMTTVTQVNQVLGISNKPLKIQNNIRAAAIQLINKKFMVYSGNGDELIEKQRTEFDKRFFEYSIHRKYLGKVK